MEAEKDSGGGMARWEAWFNLFGGFSKPLTAHFLSLLNGSGMNGVGGLVARFFQSFHEHFLVFVDFCRFL